MKKAIYTSRKKDFVTLATVLLATCVLLACAACKGFFVDPTLASIAVTPAGATIVVGATQQYQAVGTYNDGSTKVLSPVWTSSSVAAATITAGGLAKAVAAGPATITATSGGVTGTTTLTVQSAALQSISVAPTNPSISLSQGSTEPFTATGKYADATTQPLTGATWNSSLTSVATIDAATGIATPVGTGTTVIQATSGVITGSTVLTVTK